MFIWNYFRFKPEASTWIMVKGTNNEDFTFAQKGFINAVIFQHIYSAGEWPI